MTRKKLLSILGATCLLGAWTAQQFYFDKWDARLREVQAAADRAASIMDPYTTPDLNSVFGPDSALTATNLRDRAQFARYLTALAQPVASTDSVSAALVALLYWGRGAPSQFGNSFPGLPGCAMAIIFEASGQAANQVQHERDQARWVYLAAYALGSILVIWSIAEPDADRPRVRLPRSLSDDAPTSGGPDSYLATPPRMRARSGPAITNVSGASRDLFVAHRFARHASPLTTISYTHPTDEGLREGVRGLRC